MVDDSQAMRSLLKSVLEDAGFEIAAEAGNGKEALEVLERTGPVDLMLLDWNMPVMSGIDLLEKVRSDATFGPMLTMMVTTEAEAPQILRAIEAGADEYLIKPFSKRAMREKLRLLGFADDAA
ncbi:MAG TPA: response regulator [Polyangiaceae bacterium]|nr:response regulator [Polyangiaceae bacterium]